MLSLRTAPIDHFTFRLPVVDGYWAGYRTNLGYIETLKCWKVSVLNDRLGTKLRFFDTSGQRLKFGVFVSVPTAFAVSDRVGASLRKRIVRQPN